MGEERGREGGSGRISWDNAVMQKGPGEYRKEIEGRNWEEKISES